MTSTSTYQVVGMTCDHCVSSVQSEVSTIDGATDVDVDLATGQVTVSSDTPLDPAAIRAAIDEAGYELG